jgi:signal peptidase I
VLRYLVPPVGSGVSSVMARLGQRVPVLLGAGLFLLFSALAHYWRGRLSELPALSGLFAAPSAARTQGRVQRRWEGLVLSAMVVAAACAAIGVRALVRPFRVLSESMVPTLEPGDLVAGSMLSRSSASSGAPHRGDIVVYDGAAAGQRLGAVASEILVKRVVGLPGDRIEMKGDSPVINGWLVPSCDAGEYLYVLPDTTGRVVHGRLHVEFLEDRAYLTVHAFGRPFVGAYVVQPGEAFVLGDNRGNSLDSRAYRGGQGGGVPFDGLQARVSRFLIGTQRSGNADFGRLLRSVDALRAPFPYEGVQAPPLQGGITRCLQNRPADTRPPPPDRAL